VPLRNTRGIAEKMGGMPLVVGTRSTRRHRNQTDRSQIYDARDHTTPMKAPDDEALPEAIGQEAVKCHEGDDQ